MRRLLSLLGDRRRRDHRAGDPLQRVDRIIKLEVVDALLLQLVGGGFEPRVGRVIALEELVVDLGLVEQVAAKVRRASARPILLIRVP